MDKITLRIFKEFNNNNHHATCERCGSIYNLKKIGNLNYFTCPYCGKSCNPDK